MVEVRAAARKIATGLENLNWSVYGRTCGRRTNAVFTAVKMTIYSAAPIVSAAAAVLSGDYGILVFTAAFSAMAVGAWHSTIHALGFQRALRSMSLALEDQMFFRLANEASGPFQSTALVEPQHLVSLRSILPSLPAGDQKLTSAGPSVEVPINWAADDIRFFGLNRGALLSGRSMLPFLADEEHGPFQSTSGLGTRGIGARISGFLSRASAVVRKWFS
jgi:hypothetical protein